MLNRSGREEVDARVRVVEFEQALFRKPQIKPAEDATDHLMRDRDKDGTRLLVRQPSPNAVRNKFVTLTIRYAIAPMVDPTAGEFPRILTFNLGLGKPFPHAVVMFCEQRTDFEVLESIPQMRVNQLSAVQSTTERT
jgi:hypothetical protein